MTTNTFRPASRRLALTLAAIPAAVVLLAASPAVAAVPEGWETPEEVAPLSWLVVLVGLPLALAAVITLLVYVPSLVRGERYTPGLAWRNESQWFGGPRRGVEAADETDRETVEARDPGRGGASARW